LNGLPKFITSSHLKLLFKEKFDVEINKIVNLEKGIKIVFDEKIFDKGLIKSFFKIGCFSK
jgi:hypothetical protein